MASCEAMRELISGAIDDVFLADGEEARLRGHLESCADCSLFQDRIRTIVGTLRRQPSSAASPEFFGKLSKTLDDEARREGRCAEFRELVSGSLDDVLTPHEETRVEEHLEGCEECREHKARLRNVVGLLGALPPLLPHPEQLADIQALLVDCAEEEREALGLDRVVWLERWASVRRFGTPLLKLAAAVLLLFASISFLRQQLRPERRPRIVKRGPRRDPEPKPARDLPQKPLSETPKRKPEGALGPAKPTPTLPEKKPLTIPKAADPVPAGTRPSRTPEIKPEIKPGESKSQEREPVRKLERLPLDEIELARLIERVGNRRLGQERLAALRELAGFPHRKTYELLALLFGRETRSDPLVKSLRETAVEILPALDSPEAARLAWSAPVSEPRLSSLARRFRSEQAIAQLGRLAERGARDRKSGRAVAVAIGLGWRDNGAAVEPLTLALASRKRNIRFCREVALALGRIGSETSLPTLERLSSSEMTTSKYIREGAATALGELGIPEGLGVLEAVMKDKASTVRSSAALAVSRFDNPKAIGLLIGRLAHEKGRRHRRSRGAIESALFRLTGQRFLSQKDWQSWWAETRPTLKTPKDVRKIRPKSLLPRFSPYWFGLPNTGRKILFLVDLSSSMRFRNKFSLVRRELEKTLEALRPGMAFEILVFAEGAQHLLSSSKGLVKVSQRNLLRARKALELQRPRDGRTDLQAALRQIFRVQGVDTVFFITDGMPTTGDVESLEGIAYELEQANVERRITIHTVGILSGDQPLFIDLREKVKGDEGPYLRFLRSLARRHGGFFVRNRERPLPAVKKKTKKDGK